MSDRKKTKEQLIKELQLLQAAEEGRKRAEEALEEQSAFLRQLIDIDPNFIFVKDREGRFVFVNRALADAYGTTVDDLVGKTDADFNPNLEEVEHFRRDDLEVLDTLQEKIIPEEVITDADGNVRWLQTVKRPVVDKDGVARRMLGVATDITERRRAEDALRRAQEDLEQRVKERTAKLAEANASLEAEIAEHKRTGQALARERDLLQSLMHNVPDMIFFKDRESRFIRTNRAHAEFLGFADPQEVVGKTDFDIFSAEDAPVFFAEEQAIIESGQPIVDRVGQTPDPQTGEVSWLSETKVPMTDEAGQVVGLVGIARDITARKLAEAELERRSNQLQTATEVSRAATGILDVEELIQEIVELVQSRFGLYYVGLFLVDRIGEWTGEPGNWAVLRAGTGEAGQQMLAAGHKLKIGGESMIGWCVGNRQARIALDVGHEAVRFDNPHLRKTRSEMALPLIARGRVIGAMTVQSEQEAAFSDVDIAVLQTMADQVANAIENARLFNEAQQRLREQALLFDVSQKLAGASHQAEEIADIIARQFVEVTGLPEASVSLLDPESGTMHILKDIYLGEGDVPSEYDEDVFRLADYPATLRVLETLQPLVVQASDPDADPAELAYMREHDVVTLVIIPMATKGQAIGIVELEAWDYERQYSSQELNLAMTMANQAAVALENARLFDEQQRTASLLADRLEELNCLNDIGRKIDESPPVPAFLQWVTERIPPATRYPDSCVAAIEFGGQVYGVVEAIDLPCQMVQSLRVGDEVIGRLYLAYREQHEFIDGDSALLGGIAQRVSGYIENRRLFEQTQAALAELEAAHRSYLRGRWQDYLHQRETVWQSGFQYEQSEAQTSPSPSRGEGGATLAQVTLDSGPRLSEMGHSPHTDQSLKTDGNGDGLEGTELVVPIVLRGQTIGVLGMEDPHGTRQWSEEDKALVEAVSRQLALAMENARLLEETQRRAARERVTSKLSARVRASTEVDTILKTAIQEVCRELGALEGVIWLTQGIGESGTGE